MISGKKIKMKLKKSKKDKQVSFSLCRLHINTLKKNNKFNVDMDIFLCCFYLVMMAGENNARM